MATERPQSRLPLSSVLSISAPSLPLQTLSLALVVYLPHYFAADLRVDMAMVGLVWAAVRFIDIPFDVGLAVAMDRTKSRFGRYRVWLALAVPILMLSVYEQFMAPPKFSWQYLLFWTLALYFGNSIATIAQQAWSAVLAKRYHERSHLFSWQNIVGVIGNVLALLSVTLPLGLSEPDAVKGMGWLTIALLPATFLIAVFLTPETIAPEVRRPFRFMDYVETLTKPDLLRLFLSQTFLTLGPQWMSAMYLFFFEDARGFTSQAASFLLLIYIVVQIPGAFLAAVLARRIGKHWTLIASTTAFSLGLTSILFLPRGNMAVAIPAMAWCGVAAAGFGMMINAMLADVGDEIRLEQGKERIGLVYAVNGLAFKISAAVAIGVTFPMLAGLGYHAGVHNTPQAIDNLVAMFLVGPFVFVMLGGACVLGWRLDERRHGEIREALDARDAALGMGEPAWADGAVAGIPREAAE